MAATYVHVCYRIMDPEKTTDFYVNKLGMQKVGEMPFSDATNYFVAMAYDPSSDRTLRQGQRLLAYCLHGRRPRRDRGASPRKRREGGGRAHDDVC
jgi:catechol 2,3-dioxygenase-like lactoylglutathione lyase family enzyme